MAAAAPGQISFTGLNGMYLYEIIIIFCLLLLIQNRSFLRERRNIRTKNSINKIYLTGILFILSSIIGLSFSLFQIDIFGRFDIVIQLKMIAHVLLTILVISGAFIGGFSLFRGVQDLRYVSYLLFIAIFIMSLQVVYEWFIVTGGEFGRYNYTPPTGMGQGDTAKLMLIGMLISLSLLKLEKILVNRFFIIVAIIIMGISIATIQSRSSYLTALFQIVLVSFLYINIFYKQHRNLSKVVLFFIFSIILFLNLDAIFNSNLGLSLTNMLIESNSEEALNKLVVIKEGIDFFIQNIFFGIGWGMFGIRTEAEMIISGQHILVASPHNGVVQILSETGIFGFIIYCILVILIIKNLHNLLNFRFNNEVYFFISIVLLMLYTVIFTQFFTSSHLFPPPVERNSIRIAFYYWFLIGYTLSFFKIYSRST
jgi:hypothetical protein